ncbi:MAG: nitrate reductase cytochrome c-type subunit [Helicobacter sp.]|uniref:nitrate reductase cytochrome c-type subunit n=1 Tax=Helicobacter sp. 10-6591 TaxID=2004998 RepID=UPI000DCC35AB|nr:nitrate reductase cytochrome c-type subunit [Helicobacter sp. 10-6591]MDD7567649.1 nitrate reductase cytochrome c-type subunit [Helicobacter sp.]MDY5740290.1 nitrate reductase cytochrome c-type subunit [Helicobacter sp.]RAX53228.1 nitrate reductase [Helicobacter sp. 10-6591]
MKKLLFLVLAAVFVSVGLFASVSDTEIGLRKAPLESEDVKLGEYQFIAAPAGESERIERAYENAPPMIPHDIEGMTPITQQDNACIGCHDVNVASDMGATPVPKSHMFDLRANKSLEGIADSRFNCTQCHVPQANTKPLVGNNFKPDFTSENQKHQSNLLDVINQGVK